MATWADPDKIMVRASGRTVFAVSLLLAIIAIGMPVSLYLTGTPIGKVCGTLNPDNVVRIWGICLLVILGLCFFAGYLSSQRLLLGGGRIRYSSWLKNEAWPLEWITGVTHKTVSNSEGNDAEYLVLWRHGEELKQINLHGWPMEELKHLLRALKSRLPSLIIAPDALQYFEL